MRCVAIFADAGYLYGGGFGVLAGSNQPREYGQLNLPETVAKLCVTAAEQTENTRLLRIYTGHPLVAATTPGEGGDAAGVTVVQL